jgi:iron complex transport system substrate-binding protein
MPQMRVASLLPSATEIVAALGFEDALCGVSHECDFPSGVRALPKLTASRIPEHLTSGQIDELVKTQLHDEGSLYTLNEPLLRELEPNLVVTQALCDVCAVNFRTVARAVGSLPSKPELVSLEPGSVRDILRDIRIVATALGVEERGEEVARALERRWLALSEVTAGATRPRVLALEWTDPPYFGGHWVPEQIEAAGGISLFGRPHERSRAISARAILDADPDVVFLMPKAKTLANEVLCGELAGLRAIREGQFYALDANAYYSRPGPRVVYGAEVLGHLLHPELVPFPKELRQQDTYCPHPAVPRAVP